MAKPEHKRTLNKLGKELAPALSWLFNRKPSSDLIAMLSWYLAFMQGKGSGAGWDFQAEIKAALAHIDRNNLVLFDVEANIGKWAEAMVDAFGAHCKIYQFEPTRECRMLFKKHNCQMCS